MKIPLRYKLPQNINYILLWGLLIFFSFSIIYSLWIKIKEGAKGLEAFTEGAEDIISADDTKTKLNKQISDATETIDQAKKKITELNNKKKMEDLNKQKDDVTNTIKLNKEIDELNNTINNANELIDQAKKQLVPTNI